METWRSWRGGLLQVKRAWEVYAGFPAGLFPHIGPKVHDGRHVCTGQVTGAVTAGGLNGS